MEIDKEIPCVYTHGMKIQVNLKIDASVKEKAQQRAQELGLSLSSIVNATLKQFSKTGELELSAAPKMTHYLEELVTEARKDYKEGKTSRPFNNADELVKHLEI